MTIPKSPLEVSETIERQKRETEVNCISFNECEDCGTTTSEWAICPKCQRKVCTEHIDPVRGICTTCKTNMGTENKDYQAAIELAASQRLAELTGLEDDESKA